MRRRRKQRRERRQITRRVTNTNTTGTNTAAIDAGDTTHAQTAASRHYSRDENVSETFRSECEKTKKGAEKTQFETVQNWFGVYPKYCIHARES